MLRIGCPDRHALLLTPPKTRHTFSGGADTLASARPHECSPTWRHGSAEGYERTSGGNGKTALTASKNYDSVAYQSSTRRLLPARRPVSGACPDIRPSNRLCATRISPVSVFPASTFLPTLNLIEPPWYGPVCPVVWEGWLRGVPLSRSMPHCGHCAERVAGPCWGEKLSS